MSHTVTILICTRNRCGDLARTLEALRSLQVPPSWQVELVVVDNGSSDETARVVSELRLPYGEVRMIREDRKGHDIAYNTGLKAARGQVILFTDDDVRPPPDWLESMCSPILSGEADAVAGGVEMAPHLQRPWAKPMHRAFLARTADLKVGPAGQELVGANMAVGRYVFKTIPCFDPELGPGALGFKGDTLLWLQMLRSGFRVLSRPDVCVEHHFQASRWSREAFLQRALGQGRSEAYTNHHWRHKRMRLPAIQGAAIGIMIRLWRLFHRGATQRVEGIHVHEIVLVYAHSYALGMVHEQRRPRNYEYQGLIKINGLLCDCSGTPDKSSDVNNLAVVPAVGR
jgi:GT2 family glycosyltransferase